MLGTLWGQCVRCLDGMVIIVWSYLSIGGCGASDVVWDDLILNSNV